MAVRHLANEPLASRRPAIAAGHVGRGAGFVGEDKPLRIKGLLVLPQGLTCGGHVRPILFAGLNDFFLSSNPSGAKTERSRLTDFYFKLRQAGLIFQQRAIRLRRNQFRHAIGMRCQSMLLVPAKLIRTDGPRFPLASDQPPNGAQAHTTQLQPPPRRVRPTAIASTTRSRKSSE